MAFGRSDLVVAAVACVVLLMLAPTGTHGLCWPECMRTCNDFKIICAPACVIACTGKSPFYNHFEPNLVAVPAAAPSAAHRALLKLRDSPAFNNNNNNKNKEEATSSLSSRIP